MNADAFTADEPSALPVVPNTAKMGTKFKQVNKTKNVANNA